MNPNLTGPFRTRVKLDMPDRGDKGLQTFIQSVTLCQHDNRYTMDLYWNCKTIPSVHELPKNNFYNTEQMNSLRISNGFQCACTW